MHPKQEEFEAKLSQLCAALDNRLEDRYGKLFPIHPNRPKRGEAAYPGFDGLFSTSVAFTLGIGSQYGRGYVMNIDVRTLDYVDPDFMTEVFNEALVFVNSNLPVYFPERDLKLVKDGRVLKITGDFSLGDV